MNALEHNSILIIFLFFVPSTIMNYKILILSLFLLFSYQQSSAMKELVIKHPVKSLISATTTIFLGSYLYNIAKKQLFLFACKHNYLSLVKKLIDWGIDLKDARYQQADPIYQKLVQTAYLNNNKELGLLLFKYSTFYNYKLSFDFLVNNIINTNDLNFLKEFIPLLIKGNTEIVTIANKALIKGNTEIVKFLVETSNTKQNRKIFNRACHYGNTEIVELLLNKGMTDIDLDAAIESNQWHIVKLLLNKRVSKPIFSTSAMVKRKDMLKYFLDLSPDNVNYIGKDSSSFLISACSASLFDIVTLLLTYPKINLNYQAIYKSSALYAACMHNAYEIIELLLKQESINPNLKNNRANKTPLLIAADISISLINLLINSGKVAMKKRNIDKETFFYVGYQNKKITSPDQLNFFIQLTDDERIQFLTEQLCYSAQLKYADKYFSNPIHDQNKKILQVSKFIAWSIEHGADLNYRNKQLQRPVDYAYAEYEYANQHLHHNSLNFRYKQAVCHTFLQHTPYVSDAEIYYRLSANGLNQDIIKHILKDYYTMPFIVERNLAITLSLQTDKYLSNGSFCFYNNYQHKQKKIRKKVLFDKLHSIGYAKKTVTDNHDK